MCSKNQKVGYLIRAIHNKSLFDPKNLSKIAEIVFILCSRQIVAL